MQTTTATCGAAALSNALAAIGVTRSEEEMAKLARTTTDGTPTSGLERALKALGMNSSKFTERREDVGVFRLLFALQCGNPVILCVDNWEHWVAAIGVLGPPSSPRVLVADSASVEVVESLSLPQLVSRWSCEGKFHGVIL